MSTLDGAVPPGLGITKLRLWDDLHRAHCETMLQPSSSEFSAWSADDDTIDTVERYIQLCTNLGNPSTSRDLQQEDSEDSDQPLAELVRTKTPHSQEEGLDVFQQALPPLQSGCPATVSEQDDDDDRQESILDWLLSDHQRDALSRKDSLESLTTPVAGPSSCAGGILMPPPPPRPGPSRQKPPPLVARIKAKARRARRKKQKAEYRRHLFLTHLVQGTQQARRQLQALASPLSTQIDKGKAVQPRSPKCWKDEHVAQQALMHFPECAGMDLDSFVEIVFDTDAQSTEVTAPSDVSDDDLAWATRTEIDTRKILRGAEVMVPKGVFRWMVARDFAERWPDKVRHVRDNPWPGLEKVWGDPSLQTPKGGMRYGVDEEPIRWQSGRRSRFIRRKAPCIVEERGGEIVNPAVTGLGISFSDGLSEAGPSSSNALGLSLSRAATGLPGWAQVDLFAAISEDRPRREGPK